MSIKRPVYYPDSTVKVTAPFFLLACTCGLQMWSLLGEPTPCPNCGRMMQREHAMNTEQQNFPGTGRLRLK